jgi:uncharacterized protein
MISPSPAFITFDLKFMLIRAPRLPPMSSATPVTNIKIRAETIISIGVTLIDKGMGMGTAVALLIGGAGASIPEVSMLAGIFKKKLIMAILLTILIVEMITGYLTDLIV